MSEKKVDLQALKKENGKVDFSQTLNLPQTEFPMRGNLPQNEPTFLNDVFENGLYKKMLDKNEGKTPFVLHDGPPYANGAIHIGHALNKILKDTLVRYKNLQGYWTPFIPGYDTHGMPTEKKAIEKLGLDRSKIPVNQFRDTCKQFTSEYKDIQTAGFKRLGVLGDWENPYITYLPEEEAKEIEVFAGMYKKGYIYKGLKPVYWCTDCETALAEAEIEYKDVPAITAFVKFPAKETKGLFNAKDSYFVIWTTTPWTLPGNTMIAVGPDIDYALVKAGKEQYVLAKELVNAVMEKAGITDFSVEKEFKGTELDGCVARHPFLDRDSLVVTGSETTVNVELSTGSGLVHCAPSYGKEDYLLGIERNSEILVLIDEKGYQRGEGAGPFKDMFYAKSNTEIVKWLDENGFLLKAEDVVHSYPHCWRCKKPVIFRATNQWFCSVDGFRKQALEAVKSVKWVPAWGEERITKMIEERNDWCISRQRTWGVPIPAFYCKDCGKPYMTEESLQKVADIFREKGSNAWFDLSEKELMPVNPVCEECGCKEFKKGTDIMDVWFDSGSTHESVLAERGLPPADMYLEGSDQYRGWFQSSLLTSVANFNKAPYKIVLTHGYTVDEQGRKMSKSLGNGIDPQDVVKENGADVLRLWVISSDYQSDVSVSKNIIKQVSEVYRKIRNTARYILGNTSDFNPDEPVAYEDLQELDKWALSRLNKLIRACTEAYETYSFHEAYHAINQFCVVDMSQFYLDIIKDRLYTSKQDSVERRSAQTVMYEILSALVRILAPITCFTAEEIWKYMKHKKGESTESVMMEFYPKANAKWDNKELEAKWDKVIDVKDAVAKVLEDARAEKKIGLSLEAKVEVKAKGKDYEFLKENEDLLQEVCIVSQFVVTEGEPKNLADVKGVQLEVAVSQAEGEKCERCWMIVDHFAKGYEEECVCERCVGNLE